MSLSARGNRGVEGAFVSTSLRTTEEAQLISVEAQNLVNGKKERFAREVHLANFRKVLS
jgi:hypothetical protein